MGSGSSPADAFGGERIRAVKIKQRPPKMWDKEFFRNIGTPEFS
jgi:hypothetical protein